MTVTVAERMNTMNRFQELRKATGMSQTRFAEYFGIPRRTVQNWDLGLRQCPDYLIDLMEYKLRKEDVIDIILKGE